MGRGFKSFRREPSNMITSVTYYVDTNTNYTEDIPSGKTVLSPTSFVPAKTGYSFLGWREDSVASSDVLSNKTAKGKTMSLYAVFSKNITVTYYDNSTSASTDTKPQYYNNANTVDPTFQLAQTERNTWTARGWTTAASGGSSTIAYANNTAFTRNSNVTLYGCYQRTVTLYYKGNGNTGGSTANSTGTAYYHSKSGATNASISLRTNGFTRTNYTFTQWAAGSTSGTKYNAGATYSTTSDTNMYASWVATSSLNKTFSYTGGVQSYTVQAAGTYQLEVYGAQGAYYEGRSANITDSRSYCGKGGYAKGRVTLPVGTTLYVVVGGANRNSGYNGGGHVKVIYNNPGDSGAQWTEYSTGGGATHIGKTNALLKNTAVSNLYIAAGGGGGGGRYNQAGGDGGGTSGGAGANGGGAGGTQSSGYAYGQGGNGYGWSDGNYQHTNGSGGGGYYGGKGGGVNNCGGGGGSGYIGGVSSGSMSSGSQSGNGLAKITFVG